MAWWGRLRFSVSRLFQDNHSRRLLLFGCEGALLQFVWSIAAAGGFGTNLYAETGDIYLVADVLGHADVNTTRRHYAAQSDENRRRAAHSVKLRGDGSSRPPKDD